MRRLYKNNNFFLSTLTIFVYLEDKIWLWLFSVIICSDIAFLYFMWYTSGAWIMRSWPQRTAIFAIILNNWMKKTSTGLFCSFTVFSGKKKKKVISSAVLPERASEKLCYQQIIRLIRLEGMTWKPFILPEAAYEKKKSFLICSRPRLISSRKAQIILIPIISVR